MKALPIRSLAVAALILSACAAAAKADGVAEMAEFSAFGKVDLAQYDGKIATARGPKMANDRDLATQGWCLVNAPFAKTVAAFVSWDRDPHPPLGSYLGTRDTSAAAIASALLKAPDESPVKALEAATRKLPAGAEKFQLSEGDLASLPATFIPASGQMLSAGTASFWSAVLARRAKAFQSGQFPAVPPYTNGVRVSEEIARLWSEMPPIQKQFAPALADHQPALAWGLSKTDDIAAASITANFVNATADTWQRAAVTFYASSGFYAFIELYQFWPVTVNGKPQTLLWRAGVVDSATVEKLRGIERTGATSAMMREMRKSLEAFRKVAEQ